MFTQLFEIAGPWPGHLAISARPRGGDWLDDELSEWRKAGIEVVVSLLEPGEAATLDLALEGARGAALGIQFVSFPIVDRGIPASTPDVHDLLSNIDLKLRQGKNAVIHCRQGIGRAGLIAAALLIEHGISHTEAIRRVSEARGVPIPETGEQRRRLESFAGAPVFKP